MCVTQSVTLWHSANHRPSSLVLPRRGHFGLALPRGGHFGRATVGGKGQTCLDESPPSPVGCSGHVALSQVPRPLSAKQPVGSFHEAPPTFSNHLEAWGRHAHFTDGLLRLCQNRTEAHRTLGARISETKARIEKRTEFWAPNRGSDYLGRFDF